MADTVVRDWGEREW